MLKTKIIATFIVLFAFIFTYLHAEVGDKAVANFEKLNGTITFEVIGPTLVDVNVAGIFNEGFDENAPKYYFIVVEGYKVTFEDYGIPINPPQAGPWSQRGFGGWFNDLWGTTITILKNDQVLDTAVVVKP
ncbi:hypothetical protein F8M41_002117 [Gigaspora margarita]|uniref:Uncharacterized protein n=1 Tax=Gigaspora margarita TaxID=4874 RepID=A0A8H3XE20_GIGMA|nr:hypothetical protein F8M41_002117 [Gigaspora margarita]